MMKLYIRAHDLGVLGEEAAASCVHALDLDGVQLVPYKLIPEISYERGAVSPERASLLGKYFREENVDVPLIGAYFNPVHPDETKAEKGKEIFKEYLRLATLFTGGRPAVVGSETGSYNGEPWVFHPKNRTDEALDRVVACFGELADCAKESGVELAMEGAWGHVCWNVARLQEARERIASEKPGRELPRVIFDLYNYLSAENAGGCYDILAEGLHTFGKDIVCFHIKDCILKDGELKQCPVGKGMLNFGTIIPMIRKVQPDAKLVFEGTTGADILPSLEFIRQYL